MISSFSSHHQRYAFHSSRKAGLNHLNQIKCYCFIEQLLIMRLSIAFKEKDFHHSIPLYLFFIVPQSLQFHCIVSLFVRVWQAIPFSIPKNVLPWFLVRTLIISCLSSCLSTHSILHFSTVEKQSLWSLSHFSRTLIQKEDNFGRI